MCRPRRVKRSAQPVCRRHSRFFVSRDDRSPLEIEGAEIGSSLDVPMVVLVDLPTNSFAEIMSGVLQNTGRAMVVGQTTLGNVEALQG